MFYFICGESSGGVEEEEEHGRRGGGGGEDGYLMMDFVLQGNPAAQEQPTRQYLIITEQ